MKAQPIYPTKVFYEVRAVLEYTGNKKALIMRVSTHDTIIQARKAADAGEHIVKVTRQTVR